MNLNKFFLEIGVSKTEVEIYLKLLEIGSVNVSALSKASNIPRTTTHENLERLIEKGLVIQTVINNKRIVEAESPEKLESILGKLEFEKTNELKNLRQTRESVSQVVSQIKERVTYNTPEQKKTSIKYFSGQAGAKLVYQDAFSASEMRSYVNLSISHDFFPDNDNLFRNFHLRDKKNHIVKEIIEPNNESIKKAMNYARIGNFFFKVSDIPQNLTNINILLYDGRVAIVNYREPMTISVMMNHDYYENSVAIFEYLWQTLPEVEVI